MDYSRILSKPKSFFGKQKVWMARGEDLALFNTHRPNIQNLLKHSCIPESNHNLWIGLYRVGVTEDEAKTFVVVSCTDRRIRKLTRDILSSCPIFQPGQALDRFKVISKATLPETACEPQQTMQDEQEPEYEPGLRKGDKGKNNATEEYKTIRISPSITGDSYLCRQVQARQVSGKGEVRFQTATAGPLISLDGRTYQLTVAHVVNFEEKDIYNATDRPTEDWDDWDDESDGDTDSSCSVDEDVASWDISAGHNSTPLSDVSDDEVPESLSSNSAPDVATQQNESSTATTEAAFADEETIDTSVHLPSSPHVYLSERPVLEEFLIDHASSYLGFAPAPENCQISTEMDYLLIPTDADSQAWFRTSKSAELIQISDAFDLQGITEPRPIIIATASLGYMKGVVFPASSLLRPPGSKDFQTLYCIESDIAMPKGTSGSAIFDKRTGLLAGYIVLGCPEKNIWYMVPILDVLNDLEVRFCQKGKCQTRLDVEAATRLGDQRGFLNEMPPGLFRTSQGFQGGSPILMNGEHDQSMVSKSSKMTQSQRFGKHTTSISKGCQGEKPNCLDHWKSQFGHDANAPEKVVLLLAKFRELKAAFLQEMALVLPDPVKVPEIKSEAIEVGGHNRKDSLQPTAWMLDILQPFNKGKALNKRDLYEQLRRKNLSPGSPDNMTDKLNCLYIKNPDPTAIMALLKTPSRLPMKGFQDVFYNSITTPPRTIIDLNQDTWLESPCFVIEIALPYFVLSNHDKSDTKSVDAGTAVRFRNRLSSLNTQEHSCGAQDEITASHAEKDHLYTATWSMVVTGVSEQHWTVYCFDDDFFDEEERLANDYSEDPILISSSSEDHAAGTVRPTLPRAYALRALAMQLERILTYHEQAQLLLATDFKSIEQKWNRVTDEQLCAVPFSNILEAIIRFNSKLIERIDNFLSKDIHPSLLEDKLCHSLWGGVYQEPGAPESLQRIENSLSMIRDTQSHLRILDARMEKIMSQRNTTPKCRKGLHIVVITILIIGIILTLHHAIIAIYTVLYIL